MNVAVLPVGRMAVEKKLVEESLPGLRMRSFLLLLP
jgi:hypothetical protein